jgi:nitrite reductase (NADH) small subunit
MKSSMRQVHIGSVSEFADPGRRVIAFDRFEVAVFKLDGDFFAYLNQCPHMGGPVCQGKMIAKVEEIVAQDRTSQGMIFSKTKMHVVCPWHAYEFDIRTGLHPGNPRAQLRKIPITVSGDDLIVGLPDVGEHSKQGAPADVVPRDR